MNRKEFWERFDAAKDQDDWQARHKVLHREYYGQYVTPALRAALRQRALYAQCKRSKDPHFNDTTSLRRWSQMVYMVTHHPGVLSWSDAVCVLKEAMRQVLDED